MDCLADNHIKLDVKTRMGQQSIFIMIDEICINILKFCANVLKDNFEKIVVTKVNQLFLKR